MSTLERIYTTCQNPRTESECHTHLEQWLKPDRREHLIFLIRSQCAATSDYDRCIQSQIERLNELAQQHITGPRASER